MTRRDAQARVLAAQERLDLSHAQFRNSVRSWRQHMHPGRWVLGGFLAGAAVGLIPRHWIARTTMPFASLAFQLARTFVMPAVFGALRATPASAETLPDTPST